MNTQPYQFMRSALENIIPISDGCWGKVQKLGTVRNFKRTTILLEKMSRYISSVLFWNGPSDHFILVELNKWSYVYN